MGNSSDHQNSSRGDARFIVVECYCILIIYYCWEASSAYLPSRAGQMASLVKNSCFVYVNGLAPRPSCFVVGSFFHLRTLLLIAQARCLSVGRSWRASRMIILVRKLVNFVRGVPIFAMVSQGVYQERRLIHHAVSIWPTCGLEKVFQVTIVRFFCHNSHISLIERVSKLKITPT